MIKYKNALIIEHDGKEIEMPFPTGVAEVTFSDFLDFRSPIWSFVQSEVRAQEAERKNEEERVPLIIPENMDEATLQMLSDSQKEAQKEPQKPPTEAEYLLNSFKYFCVLFEQHGYIERPELIDILNRALSAIIAPEHLSILPVHHEGDDLQNLLQDGVNLFDEKGLSLTRLLCYLCRMFSDYVAIAPNVGIDYCFEYKGETYYITPEQVKRIHLHGAGNLGGEWARLTTNAVFEIAETRRIFETAIQEKGDPDGSLEFRMDLRMLAVLARKNNENLPTDKQERALFIDTRGQHFADIPMSIVYNVRAFFLRILKDLLMSQITQLTTGKPLLSQRRKAAKRQPNVKPKNMPKVFPLKSSK